MAVDPLAQFSTKSADRILEPMDRISEVLFGLIMALTFTLTLGVVIADTIQVRTCRRGDRVGLASAYGLLHLLTAGYCLQAHRARRLQPIATPVG